jgi:dTDP-4-amino-4,6-dideoxygalactose transaminase
VDIDPVTFNLDPAQIEKKITPRTKAIMPVHLFGQMADMGPIMAVAEKHRLIVIEDAAQAIGSEYQGRRAGSIGHYGCFSFFPSKNLGCFGDGGMVVANSAERLDRLKLFRNHGSRPKYYHHCVGGNFRLDALQAAVLSVKLKYLDLWTLARQNNAREYEHLFTSRHLTSRVALPKAAPTTTRHIYNQYCIRVAAEKRQGVLDGLKEAHIGCEVYYPVPMHLQPCFAKFGYREGEFPESERAARESLALPIYPETTREQRHYIVETLKLLIK